MEYLKKLYGKTKVNSSDYKELKGNDEFELEYYRTRKRQGVLEDSKPYGIEIIKKIIKDEKMEVTVFNNIFAEECKTNNLLDILISNKVTPIGVEDVLEDLITV